MQLGNFRARASMSSSVKQTRQANIWTLFLNNLAKLELRAPFSRKKHPKIKLWQLLPRKCLQNSSFYHLFINNTPESTPRHQNRPQIDPKWPPNRPRNGPKSPPSPLLGPPWWKRLLFVSFLSFWGSKMEAKMEPKSSKKTQKIVTESWKHYFQDSWAFFLWFCCFVANFGSEKSLKNCQESCRNVTRSEKANVLFLQYLPHEINIFHVLRFRFSLTFSGNIVFFSVCFS